jgi:hypothetical protein
MWVLYGIAWALAGAAIAGIGLAVSRPVDVPSRPLAVLLGLGGGFAGGLVIELLSRSSVFGFTAGFIGSLVSAMVLLVLWTIVTPEHPESGARRV